ncbi:MAG TPA: STAS domain-containing protein [Acidiphilium sp.]|jgi:chemotaxis protein CheX|uniref:STAS domain-containing protein n=1 Tax=unclassified Acidiphilium TaxID=2617493 RepID=UPI00157A57B3|nr:MULTISPECIES: STAS domain-containing protein [unclassified Acidiphilium]HQT61609.1 STAS domain-containing protein [Acidiphilium sp.]HQU10904.1 STAS domain-containing protein [Acidiphilium sp.]
MTDIADSFALDPVLDLKAATPLAQGLLARRGAELRIDGALVERLGGQCLQVLLSARSTWEADGHAFVMERMSDQMVAALELFGVGPAAFQFQKDIAA